MYVTYVTQLSCLRGTCSLHSCILRFLTAVLGKPLFLSPHFPDEEHEA